MTTDNEYLKLWPDNPAVAAAVDLCEGFTARDWKRVRRAFDEDIVFSVPGTNAIAGEYKGIDTCIGLLEKMVEMTGGTLRFVPKPESYDILLSPYHLAVLVPFAAERDERKLEFSYQVWQFGAHGKLGSFSSIYVADPVAFDKFWAA